MKIKYIFIANLAEIARKLVSYITDETEKEAEIKEDFGLCDRFLISDRDERVLITSWPIDKNFLSDTKKIFDFKNILNLYPAKPSISLCEDILKDQKLKESLTALIKENNPEVYSYAVTPEFIELIKLLKKEGLKFNAPETPKGGCHLVSFFGSKAGFRETFSKEKIGEKLGIAMPYGFIAENGKELLSYASTFYQKRKNFVIKATSGLAGAGSKIIDIKETSLTDLEKLINQFDYWSKGKSVIEEFISPDLKICGGSPSIEFAVGQSRINYLYSCGMKIVRGGVFRGIEVGKEVVPLWIEEKMTAYGFKFAKILAKNGYRGYFDTDFVISKDKKLYPLEANVRRTGGTHVYEAGMKLLGNSFLENYYLASNNLYENEKLRNFTYQKLKIKLAPLLYPINNEKRGLILTMVSLLPEGKFGYLVIGKNKDEVLKVERKMDKIFTTLPV